MGMAGRSVSIRQSGTGCFSVRGAGRLRPARYTPKSSYGFLASRRDRGRANVPRKPAQLLHIPLRWQAAAQGAAGTDVRSLRSARGLAANRSRSSAARRPQDAADRSARRDRLSLAHRPSPAGGIQRGPAPPQEFFSGSNSTAGPIITRSPCLCCPVADRLEILLSTDPKEPGVPLGDPALRPSKERQNFYVYVKNLSEKPAPVIVELLQTIVLVGGTVSLTAPPGRRRASCSRRVARRRRMRPRRQRRCPVEAAPLKQIELPELTSPLQIRVLDKERPQEVLAMRTLNVDLAQPRNTCVFPRFDSSLPARRTRARIASKWWFRPCAN